MSSKLNVGRIISRHIATMADPKGNRSTLDLFVFYFLPLVIAIIAAFLQFNINENLLSLLVNFGSIFTALLFSVLVLVYDQKHKLDSTENSKPKSKLTENKETLLKQLFDNISYSILLSIILILLCFFHSILSGKPFAFNLGNLPIEIKLDIQIITPLIIFSVQNLFLTIIMIMKRMHVLITSN
jgi:hypothetical protein